MRYQHGQGTYPPTLVFNSVEGFLQAVQQRSLTEIGCARLKRIKPFEGGMLQRHIAFVLLTARDHTRDEVLACSILLTAGDFGNDNELWTPRAEWKQQEARAERVQAQLQVLLRAVAHVRIVDAAYHVHPDVCMRFATVERSEAESSNETGEERL